MIEPVRLTEHGKYTCPEGVKPSNIYFRDNEEKPYNKKKPCISIKDNKLCASYYVGADWLTSDCAVQVNPKIKNIDFQRMLADILDESSIDSAYLDELYEIKLDRPQIDINNKEDDWLTLLIIAHFLQLISAIVRKGLKKGFYPVEQDLRGRIKGKIMLPPSIRNTLKGRTLHIRCRYNEFGLNCIENRLLKHTLGYVRRYMDLQLVHVKNHFASLIGYCSAAFQAVDEDIDYRTRRSFKFKTNAFYREYDEALRLAQLILRRFSYTIRQVESEQYKLTLPPFWIDMSKLFELYVLVRLRGDTEGEIDYQYKGSSGDTPDFLRVSGEPMIIDAKYKPKCYEGSYDLADIRQLSGYGRNTKIRARLGVAENSIVDCLIIYPKENEDKTLPSKLTKEKIPDYKQFFKLGIRLPVSD